MGFRINRGIFQFRDGEEFVNKFKIAEDGNMVEVNRDGEPVAAYMKIGDQATDSDLLDGLSSGSFIRSDASDNVTGHTEWQDNYNIRLGNSADFRMYFDGSHTYFRNFNHGNGNIYFQGEDTAGANHALLYMFTANTRPYVSLYEDGGERFKTTSAGVEVLGEVRASNGIRLVSSGAYGIIRGYDNDNHFIVIRGSVATGTSTLSITGAHRTTFVEHVNEANEGWYFVSKASGNYTEMARIDGVGQMYIGGNKVWHAGNLTNVSQLSNDADYFKGTTRSFTVDGDPETWYPVRFRLYTMHQTFVFRKHVHNSGQWDGDLSAVFVGWSSTWGGDNGYLKPLHIISQSHDFIGKYRQSAGPNNYAIFWFKGGGRTYNYQTYPAYVSAEVFLDPVDMGSDGRWEPEQGLTMENITFDTALDEARAAQTTADNAATAAAAAQTTATTAETRANGAKTAAADALAAAAAAQTTADSKLGATAKAADSNLLDGIDSGAFLRSNTDDNVTGHTEWQDNYQVRLGNGADLRIWHDGNNHVFRSYHHGANYYFQLEDNEGTNRNAIILQGDTSRSYVRLYEDGNERLRTVSDGIRVYGSARIDGSTNNGRLYSDEWGVKVGTDNGHIQFGPANTSHAHIYTDRPNFYINKPILENGARLATQTWTDTNFLRTNEQAVDADTVDGYHASRLFRIDGTAERGPDFNALIAPSNQTFVKELHVINEGSDFPSGAYTYGLLQSTKMTNMKLQWYVPHTASRGDHNTQDTIYFRTGWGGTQIYDWKYLIHSGNIAGQSVNYATTAGSANAVTWGNVSGKPSTFAPSSHTHNKIVENSTITYGQGSLQWMDISDNGGTGYAGSNPANPFNDWHHHIVMNHANSNGYYVDMAFSFHNDRVHFRRKAGGGDSNLSSWREFWHTGNFDPSTKEAAGTAAAEAGAVNQRIDDEVMPRITEAQNAADAAQATADGKAAAGGSYSQDFKADDMRVDQWFRNTVSGKGLYNEATGQHFYSDDDDYWNIAGGSAANALRFRDEHAGTIRGYVYANSSNQVGFLDAGGSWAVRHYNDHGTYFYTDNATEEFKVGRDAVTGNYGTVQTETTRGGWGGYSIDGRVVFMHDHSSGWGIYNDVNNEWMIYGRLNEYVQLRYNNSTKLQTNSGGVTVTGTVSATAFSGDGSGLTNLPIPAAGVPVTINGDDQGSTLASINFNIDRRSIEFILSDGQSFAAVMA